MSSRSGQGHAARLTVLAILAVVTVLAVWLPPDPNPPVPRITGEIQQFEWERNPRAVADVAFRNAAGREVSFADFRGKVVVLNFWATWCAPCVHEMPSLDRLAAKLADKPFTLIALNEDREGAKVAAPFLAKLGLERLALYTDAGGAVQRALEVGNLPTTVVLDARGREVGRLIGPADWASREAVALVEFVIRAAD